ncbi:PREDICTED: optic atrophy 3 protein homolog [Priapulus caudatus]|uniref:Optic atrophy 3 protein homolog n=1 Tax=Priapulus caudatus TaxID=37621 RepID=A0ABM1DRQ6_PRICU|nr:PREDICTED: optic atrophy 3 protein homolog [Priapulus caudatus]
MVEAVISIVSGSVKYVDDAEVIAEYGLYAGFCEQSYHWADMQLKMRFLGLKPTNIEKLNEAMAIELGTDMLGEMAIFTMAAAILYLESWRSSSKDQRKENQQNVQLDKLTESVQEMSITVAEQDAKIRELMHRLAELNAPNYKKVIQFVVTKDPDEKPSR